MAADTEGRRGYQPLRTALWQPGAEPQATGRQTEPADQPVTVGGDIVGGTGAEAWSKAAQSECPVPRPSLLMENSTWSVIIFGPGHL